MLLLVAFFASEVPKEFSASLASCSDSHRVYVVAAAVVIVFFFRVFFCHGVFSHRVFSLVFFHGVLTKNATKY